MLCRKKLFIKSLYHIKRSSGELKCSRCTCIEKKYFHEEKEKLADSKLSESYTTEHVNHWNNVWESQGYFSPKNNDNRDCFRMILPPPNITGVLHLGHALTCTIQDVLARWARMKDKSVIWVPGFDHAGIATQTVVEKYLESTRGISRHDLSRQEFDSCIEKWKEEKINEIRSQLKSLGTSLDWSREFFTMSKEHNEAVIEAFIILNKRGLLYRKNDLINWSTFLGSTISDIEVEHVRVMGNTSLRVPGYEKKVPFGLIATISLNLRDSKDEICIATTRVETMPGDVAIAVHPEDPRYSRFIGQEVWHPIRNAFIPIIADHSVKRDFGTGAVKITPAHDHSDLEVSKRHNLEVIDVIGEDGNMTSRAKPYEGLGRFTAREKILEELSGLGILKRLEDHEMLVPICSRSGDVVEHLMKEQWFLKTKKMAELAVEALESNSLTINQPEWARLWCEWLQNNRDWCVSRQIWWGHRIPAYRCEGSDWVIAHSEKEAREKFIKIRKNKNIVDFAIEQDHDVLDTWFSSALLPFTAMGWPDRKFEKWYPLDLMETGHDIMFLWVARMVMLGTELTGVLPFKEVLFHGVLCDADGKKMSKSRGNVIKPEHIIDGTSLETLNAEAEESFKNGILSKQELKRALATNKKMFPDGIPQCGVDALRLTLCSANIKNPRLSFDVIESRTNKYFCNKIWQATKFILKVSENEDVKNTEELSSVDRWILSRLSLMVEKVNDCFEKRNFHKAILAIKQFFHYEFCDFFLETTKVSFKNEGSGNGHRYVLAKCLEVTLRILAPVAPYVCEELYSHCAKKLPHIFSPLPSLIEAKYPTFTPEFQSWRDENLEKRFDNMLNVLHVIRQILAQIGNKSNIKVHIITDNTTEDFNDFTENMHLVLALTKLQNIQVIKSHDYIEKEKSLSCNISGSDCRVSFQFDDDSLADIVKQRIDKKRLEYQKKLEKIANRHLSKSGRFKETNHKIVQNLEEELKRYPRLS